MLFSLKLPVWLQPPTLVGITHPNLYGAIHLQLAPSAADKMTERVPATINNVRYVYRLLGAVYFASEAWVALFASYDVI